jgi:hypothetical protein
MPTGKNTKQGHQGRPELLPWNEELPNLLEARLGGATYIELADTLSDRYNIALTPQSVRTHLAPHLTKNSDRTYARARADERNSVNEADAERLANWMLNHPAATRRDAAGALNLPLYRVELLMPAARKRYDGYLIPPTKQGREQFTEEQMLNAIRQCAKEMVLNKGEPISEYRYADWRKDKTPKQQEKLPSPIAYRRRFGTWTQACALAGLHANPLPRDYVGLSVEDIVIWMAHWLRSIKQSGRGLVDASQGEYRRWIRQTPSGPSEELIRLRGNWANLLNAASVLEKTVKKLPEPKPVGTEGRVKKAAHRRRARNN